jgi:hypothetical protein
MNKLVRETTKLRNVRKEMWERKVIKGVLSSLLSKSNFIDVFLLLNTCSNAVRVIYFG